MIVGIALSATDLISDALLAEEYHRLNEYNFFYWTLAFLAAPAFIASMFSFFWEIDTIRLNRKKQQVVEEQMQEMPTETVAEKENENESETETDGGYDVNEGPQFPRWFGIVEFFLGPLRDPLTRITPQFLIWHFLLLGGFYRSLRGLFAPKRFLGEEEGLENIRDAQLLGLIESFLEDAPQAVLQVSIITNREALTGLQLFDVVTSILSLAWAIVDYFDALRTVNNRVLPNAFVLTLFGQLSMWMWRVGMIGSRMLAMAIFFDAFGVWLVLIAGVHWAGMFWWLLYQKTTFCFKITNLDEPDAPQKTKNRKCSELVKEIIFDLVIGAVGIFCFINMKRGRTRWRMTSYYVIMFVENSLLGVLWYFNIEEADRDAYKIIVLSLVWISFVYGLLWLCVYYTCAHPTKQYHGGSDAAQKFIHFALQTIDNRVRKPLSAQEELQDNN